MIHAHMRSQEYACAKCGTGESTALSLTFPSPRHDICRGGLTCKPMRRLRRMQHSYACARLARRPGRIRRRWWRERGRERPARGCTYGRAGEERMAAILAYCRRGGITSPATETARRVPSAVLASSTSVLSPPLASAPSPAATASPAPATASHPRRRRPRRSITNLPSLGNSLAAAISHIRLLDPVSVATTPRVSAFLHVLPLPPKTRLSRLAIKLLP